MALLQGTNKMVQAISDRLFRGVSEAEAQGDLSRLFGVVDRAIQETEDDRKHTQKLRDFYEGDQIIGTGLRQGEYYIPQWPDESDEDLLTRSERMDAIRWNRVRDGVHTHTDVLYAWGHGRGVSRTFEFPDDLTEAERAEVERYFRDRVWRLNTYPSFMWSVWKTAISEGRAVVMNMWMDGSTARPSMFSPTASRGSHAANGFPYCEILDNLTTLTIPHPQMSRDLGAVIRWYANPEDLATTGDPSVYPGNRGTITELITDDLWIRWNGREAIPTVWGYENRYGDVRTVFVVADDPSGLSDTEDALGSQVLLLEHLYNLWEVGRQHAFPETLYAGYTPPTRDEGGRQVLERGPNVAHQADDASAKIMKVSPEVSMQELGLTDELMHQALNEAMSLSFMERGSGGDFGQLRSAPAMARIQAKSERRRRRKIIGAMDFEERLARAQMDMWAYHGLMDSMRDRLRSVTMVAIFPDDAFSLDPFTEAQKDQVEVQAGLTDRRDVVRKRYPSLSDDQLTEKVEAIEESMTVSGEMDTRDPDPTAETRSAVQEDI